jgi:hypothetical protein
MKKLYFITGLVLLAAGAAVFMIFSGSLYFKEGEEFRFNLRDANDELIFEYSDVYGNMLSEFDVLFLEKEYVIRDKYTSQPAVLFHFNNQNDGSPVTLSLPESLAEDISLTPGTTYRMLPQLKMGWPSAYCLIITRGQDLVFMGIADWDIDGIITIEDEYCQFITPSINVEQLGKLALRTRTDPPYRMTDTELEFRIGDETVRMHQGESSEIGDYRIKLMVARDVEYTYEIIDGGVNKISYTITRINRTGFSSN